MSLNRTDRFRIEGLRAAAQMPDLTGDRAQVRNEVIMFAGTFADWLGSRTASIHVGVPMVADQADPGRSVPASRNGSTMAFTMTDGQQATFPAADAKDSKGFDVAGEVVLTTDDDAAGAVVTRTDNADGSSLFLAVAPGVVTLTWTDGAISLVEVLQVTTGEAATISVGDPVIEDQPAAP